jgi:hypothetical protein
MDRKILDKIEKALKKGNYRLKKNTRYNAGALLGKEYDGVYYTTDKKRNITSISGSPMDEEFKRHVESKAKATRKKEYKDADKNKEQLKKLKEDPEYLRGELDKLYLDYDKKEADLQDYLDEEGMLPEDITEKDPKHAKARKLQNQLKSTTFKLYDKAKAYSGITGEDEKARAFQYVVGRQFEEELPGNVPTPQFQPNPNVQKKTDEELLRELQQLKQRK